MSNLPDSLSNQRSSFLDFLYLKPALFILQGERLLVLLGITFTLSLSSQRCVRTANFGVRYDFGVVVTDCAE